jgi:beta-ribofuranosylaminobenzene 5'-phosphate synthase
VIIQTGARLHFGLLSYGQPDLPQFGGIGMMIARPGFNVRATVAATDRVIGSDDVARRVTELVAKYRRETSAERVPPVCLDVRSIIPAHVGLGSGTQLGMAVATALATIAGERDVPASVLARRVGRGARSAIGIHGFDQGGFLVDGGKRESSPVGPLAVRAEVPPAWRIVLVRPRDIQGVSGPDEKTSFARLSPMPEATTNRLCRLALMELLPAVTAADWCRFSTALYEFGILVGEYFAPVQGGTFAHPGMERLSADVRSKGFAGIAQSSWGPTIAIVCRDNVSAESLTTELRANPEWNACDIDSAAPLNTGATIRPS